MLRELLAIFRSEEPLAEMGATFSEMMELSRDLTRRAGEVYFGAPIDPEERTALLKQDVKINKLERKVRKYVISHLALPGHSADAPYGLLLMSLVKDVERIGDYAKNLLEIVDFRANQIPDDEITAELKEIRDQVENALATAAEVFGASDRERALELIHDLRDVARRCDLLVERIARSDYGARDATAAALGARYYKRIASHVLNVFTGVVMPLHRVDYYDEKHVMVDDGAEEDRGEAAP